MTPKIGSASPIPQQRDPDTVRTDCLRGGQVKPYMTAIVLARFMAKIVAGEHHCWIWIGCRDEKGYGQLKIAQRHLRAHRVSYQHFVGPIPAGLQMDHLCRNKSCVNPAHLEAVTPRENTMRGHGPTALNARKTHCKHGHPLSGSNLGKDRDWRRCLTCTHENSQRASARRSAARAKARAMIEPSTIDDPVLRAAFMAAHRAWAKTRAPWLFQGWLT